MAALGNIRRRSALLFAVIGIAMLAFIMTDFFNSMRSGGSSNIVGKIYGENITIQQYEAEIEKITTNWKNQNPNAVLNSAITAQLRNQAWEDYMRDIIMNSEYSKIGLDVSEEEWWELLQGSNAHPEIQNIPSFQDPSTGVFDRTKVVSYVQNIDQDNTGEAKSRWITFQNYLISLQKSEKYNKLINESLYITDYYARNSLDNKGNIATFDYVSIPYTTIDDSVISISKKEIKSFYQKNITEYKQDPSKDVDYVVFPVVPSKDDEDEARISLEKLASDFKNYDDCILLAKRHSDNIGARFTFQAKDDFTDPNWAELSFQQEGTVIGPYLLSEGVYRISRNLETSFRPDSVEARHILIRPSSVVSIDSAQRFVDKLKQSIEKELNQNQQDALFAELAKKYSEDSQSAIKGGDLGWFKEGLMVDEFNEICFTSKTRDLKSVTSQFGVHLVQVIKKSKKVKKSKIIYIDRYVDPSTQTFNTYYSEAAQFAGKILNENITFDSLVQLKNLVKRTDVNVSRDKQAISGLPESREMIRWMNKSNVGDVSEVFQFGDSYVVAFLKKSREDEYLPIEEIEEEIIAKITNEKKGEIIAKFTANKDLEDIALEYNILVNKQKTIAFDNSNIPGVGFEPKLVGSVFALPLNITSKPILGNNSAFVVQVTAKNSDSKNENIAQEKNRIRTEILRYSSLSYNSLKNNAEIEDFRSDFY